MNSAKRNGGQSLEVVAPWASLQLMMRTANTNSFKPLALRFSYIKCVPNSWTVYFTENPIKVDDLGVPRGFQTPTLLFMKASNPTTRPIPVLRHTPGLSNALSRITKSIQQSALLVSFLALYGSIPSVLSGLMICQNSSFHLPGGRMCTMCVRMQPTVSPKFMQYVF